MKAPTKTLIAKAAVEEDDLVHANNPATTIDMMEMTTVKLVLFSLAVRETTSRI